MPDIGCLMPFGPTKSTRVGLGELPIGVGEHVVNKWECEVGLGKHGLALARPQSQIPPIVLLHLIGPEKIG